MQRFLDERDKRRGLYEDFLNVGSDRMRLLHDLVGIRRKMEWDKPPVADTAAEQEAREAWWQGKKDAMEKDMARALADSREKFMDASGKLRESLAASMHSPPNYHADIKEAPFDAAAKYTVLAMGALGVLAVLLLVFMLSGGEGVLAVSGGEGLPAVCAVPAVPRSQVFAAVLALAAGWFGAHRFYLGYPVKGTVLGVFGVPTWALLMLTAMAGRPKINWVLLMVALAAVIGVWVLVDLARILSRRLRPSDGSGYREEASAAEPAAPAAVLAKLAELHGNGALTDAEFAAKKAEILARM